MAIPILTGRQQIAIELEPTAGTDSGLLAANVVLHNGIAEYEPDVTMTPRSAMSASLSPRGSVVGRQSAKIRFQMHLRGVVGAITAATNEPEFAVPFYACGAPGVVSGGGGAEIMTFKPSSTSISDDTSGSYATVALYEDGKRYCITGAQGDRTLTFTTGQPVLAEFEFTGVYNAPTDAALLVPAYEATIEPAFLSATLSMIGSFTTPKIGSLKLSFGNTVTMRPYPNGATGNFTAQITGRNPTVSFDSEETLASVNNFWTQWIAGTTGAITTGDFPSTGTQYNKFNLNIPKAAYTKIGLADRDGIATAPADFECRANSDAGEDEWTLVCK